MATIKIRNKTTGEVKVIPQEQASSYLQGGGMTGNKPLVNGADNPAVQIIQSRLQELQQPKQTQPQEQGDFMTRLLKSRALPIGGGIAGGAVGTLAGPVTGVAGATGGAMAGDVARKELAGLLGVDLGEGQGGVASQTGNTQSVAGTAKTGIQAGKAQAIGELGGALFKLLKPGTISKLFSNLTDYFSKGAKGSILADVVKERFINETIPKAWAASGELKEEAISQTGKKLIEKLPQRIFDAEDLNFVRKQLNALGKGEMSGSLTKFLANDLARILKEEQFKLVPTTKATILAQRVLGQQIPNMFRQLPFGRFLLGTGAQGNTGLMGLLGTGASKVGGALSRFALPGMIQNSQQ